MKCRREQHQDVKDHQKKKKRKHDAKKARQEEVAEESSSSMNMIEELMLMSYTTLPVYFDHVIDKTKCYLKWVEIEYKV